MAGEVVDTGAVEDHRANLNEVVDTPIPASGAEDKKPKPAAADEPAKQEETTEQQEAKKQSKFQRRLDRQKAARVAAETETRLLRERIAKLEAQPKATTDSGEPKRDDYPDYEAYFEAKTTWRAEQVTSKALKADREERQKQEGQGQAARDQQALSKSWTERETTFQKTATDYAESVTEYVEEELGQLSDAARRAIIELGPQVLYHLSKNPEAHERIAALSPYLQVAELGKLDVQPPKVKVSGAPPPARTGSAGKTALPGYREDMSDAEYREYRKGQGATWAR